MTTRYQPLDESEKEEYEELWHIATHGSSGLAGKRAVKFFMNSHVSLEDLQNIWSMSTSSTVMGDVEFYTAIRYIALLQQGYGPLSSELLENTMDLPLGPPIFEGINDHYHSPDDIPEISASADEYMESTLGNNNNRYPQYAPRGQEVEIMLKMWQEANPKQFEELSSNVAIKYLKRFGVHLGYLKKIWKMTCSTESMNYKQFCTFLRYISMIKSGEIDLNREKLQSMMDVELSIPSLEPEKPPLPVSKLNLKHDFTDASTLDSYALVEDRKKLTMRPVLPGGGFLAGPDFYASMDNDDSSRGPESNWMDDSSTAAAAVKRFTHEQEARLAIRRKVVAERLKGLKRRILEAKAEQKQRRKEQRTSGLKNKIRFYLKSGQLPPRTNPRASSSSKLSIVELKEQRDSELNELISPTSTASSGKESFGAAKPGKSNNKKSETTTQESSLKKSPRQPVTISASAEQLPVIPPVGISPSSVRVRGLAKLYENFDEKEKEKEKEKSVESTVYANALSIGTRVEPSEFGNLDKSDARVATTSLDPSAVERQRQQQQEKGSGHGGTKCYVCQRGFFAARPPHDTQCGCEGEDKARFHPTCLTYWLKNSALCPRCNRKIYWESAFEKTTQPSSIKLPIALVDDKTVILSSPAIPSVDTSSSPTKASTSRKSPSKSSPIKRSSSSSGKSPRKPNGGSSPSKGGMRSGTPLSEEEDLFELSNSNSNSDVEPWTNNDLYVSGSLSQSQEFSDRVGSTSARSLDTLYSINNNKPVVPPIEVGLQIASPPSDSSTPFQNLKNNGGKAAYVYPS